MKSSYAYVCNVTSARKEVVMLFGINQRLLNNHSAGPHGLVLGCAR